MLYSTAPTTGAETHIGARRRGEKTRRGNGKGAQEHPGAMGARKSKREKGPKTKYSERAP